MPSKSLQAIGDDALQRAPKPLQRVLHGLNLQFGQENGPVSAMAGGTGAGNPSVLAGVERGSPNRISVLDSGAFQRNAPQLVAHEGTHVWQNNLPPALQAKIPQDNPSDPYNYGGTSAIQSLVKRGGTLLDLPREQQAAAMQYGQVHGMPEPYKSLANTMNSIPLSTIDQTDPSAKEINTHPRAPLPPIMNYAQETYKKGQPAPGDDPYAAYVQTGTVGGHAPDDTPVGVAQGVSNPSAAPSETDPYAAYSGAQQNPEEPYDMQLLRSIPTAAKSIGKGALEGLGSTLNNLRQITPGAKGTPEEEQKLQSLLTPSGDENDVFGQKLGKGIEQAGEFLIPGLGEEKAASLIPDLKYAKPLARIGYNALASGALNKAQGGDFSTGAISGGLGSAGGQALEAAAPGVAEQALGIRGKVDRAFNKDPGRAVLDEIKGLRPDTISTNARNRINDLSGQVNDIADAASMRPNPVKGLLSAPPEIVPLGSTPEAPDMPGGLFDAQRYPVQNVGEARVIRRPNGQIMPKADRNVEFPNASGKLPAGRNYSGQFLSRQPTRQAFMTGAEGEVGATPEFSGPGVWIKQPQGGGAPIPSAIPNPIASLAPARGAVNSAAGNAARQNAEGAFDQLSGMGKFLNRNFMTGESIPENVTPRQLLDMRRGFNEEFGQWNPERKDATINAGRQAYSALSNELHSTLPDIAPLDARISSLIPVKNRAQIKALGDDTMSRVMGRFGRHTGALAGAGIGAGAGYKEGGTSGAIAGGLFGLVAPELMASPTTQMAGARILNQGSHVLRPLVGGALQFNRNNDR